MKLALLMFLSSAACAQTPTPAAAAGHDCLIEPNQRIEIRSPANALIDTQWSTPHLSSLGVVEIPRVEYLARLASALAE